MKKVQLYAYVFFVGLLVLATACERHIPNSSDARTLPDAGPAPSDVTVSLGSQSVTLTWSMTQTNGIVRYRIYRSDSAGLDFTVYDSATTTQITITGLVENRLYLFQIVPVLSTGLEGERSVVVSARIVPLSVVINAGNEYTNSRNVQIQVNSSVAVTSIRISEDPAFADAAYEAYAALQGFSLSAGDGTKTVYVDLLFTDGSTLESPLSDDIILDTKAKIDSVAVLSGSQTYGEGDTVKFALYVAETGGTASVSFAGRGTALVDDGSDIDVTADDGIYSGFYVIPSDVNAFEATVSGAFRDQAGNQATTVTAGTKLNIQTAPLPVQLSAVAVNPSQINLSWTRTSSTDFAAYRVYRSATSTVNQNSELLTTVTTPALTSYTDTDVKPGNTFYYAVYVFNISGLTSASSSASATTPTDPVPAAVVLTGDSVAVDQADLSWTISTDDDFAYYRLYRDLSSNVNEQSALIAEISNKQQVTYTSLITGAAGYNYRVYVIDIHGQSSPGSNTVNPQ